VLSVGRNVTALRIRCRPEIPRGFQNARPSPLLHIRVMFGKDLSHEFTKRHGVRLGLSETQLNEQNLALELPLKKAFRSLQTDLDGRSLAQSNQRVVVFLRVVRGPNIDRFLRPSRVRTRYSHGNKTVSPSLSPRTFHSFPGPYLCMNAEGVFFQAGYFSDRFGPTSAFRAPFWTHLRQHGQVLCCNA